MHDPFTIYEHNQPAGTEWTYQQLTPAEQAVVNRGLSDDSRAVNDAFACAATRRTDEARAEAAANRMGIDTLQMGVVP